MKLHFKKKYITIAVLSFLVIAASILFYTLVNRLPTILDGINNILVILAPIIWGISFAYILNPVLTFFEKKCFAPIFKKMKNQSRANKLSRGLGVFSTLLCTILLISALLSFVIPQVLQNILDLFSEDSPYLSDPTATLKGITNSIPFAGEYIDAQIAEWIKTLGTYVTTNIPDLLNLLSNIAGQTISFLLSIKDLLIGILVSAYIMYSKEVFCSQAKRLSFALFSKKFAKNLVSTVHISDRIFGGFISGRLLDAAIIGALCFIFTTIAGIPYALLVSVLIGVANIIPFFGPLIGAIPSVFILLLADPIKAVVFLVFIIILQQIDGNFIAPKIIGDLTGLSAFWVIASILIFGGLFGVIGMFIGVPTFAVIYTIAAIKLNKRITKKGITEAEWGYAPPEKTMPKE